MACPILSKQKGMAINERPTYASFANIKGGILRQQAGSIMAYIRTKPSNVFIMEFSGYPTITDIDLQQCVRRFNLAPDLSNKCEILPYPTMEEFIHPPRIYAANQEIVNGEAGKTMGECFWECVLGHPVKTVAEVGGGAILSGSIPKAVIKKSSRSLGRPSKFTSIPSIVAHYFPKLDDKLTKATGGLLTGRAPVVDLQRWPPRVYITTTKTPLRFIGRWIPAIGWGLLASDLAILDQCIAECRGSKSLLRTVWDEFFGIKPAY